MGKFDHRSTKPGNLSGTWTGKSISVSTAAHSHAEEEGATANADTGSSVRFSSENLILTVKEQFKSRFAGHIEIGSDHSPIVGAIDYEANRVFMTSKLGMIDGHLSADGTLRLFYRIAAEAPTVTSVDLMRAST